jgi:hypothetical protein
MTLDKSQYIERLKDGIVKIEKLFESTDSKMIQGKPVSGKWSMLECLCHINDFEIINLDRIKRIIAENNPLIFSASEHGYAQKLFYDKRDFNNEMTLFLAARRQLIEIVSHLKNEDFERTCVHNEMGKMTAAAWIGRTCGHVEHHFVFIDEKRIALGLSPIGCKKPVDFS